MVEVTEVPLQFFNYLCKYFDNILKYDMAAIGIYPSFPILN